MPTFEEMKQAIEQIGQHCESHHGKHAYVLSELASRLSFEERRLDVPPQQRETIIRDQYYDAISTLLSLALTPNTDTLDRTLNRLSRVSDVQLKNVDVMNSDSELSDNYALRDSLPKKRLISILGQEVLKEFQEQLPKTDWQRWVKPAQDGDN